MGYFDGHLFLDQLIKGKVYRTETATANGVQYLVFANALILEKHEDDPIPGAPSNTLVYNIVYVIGFGISFPSGNRTENRFSKRILFQIKIPSERALRTQ